MSSCRRTTFRGLRLLAASFLGLALLAPLAAHADDVPGIPELPRKLTVTVDAGYDPQGYRQARGSVTSQPAGVACALTEKAPVVSLTCASYFAANSTVVLTANPQTSVHCIGGICSTFFGGPSVFTGWSGACASSGSNPTCIVSMDQAKTVSARFDLPQEKVSVRLTGEKRSILALKSVVLTSVATGTVRADDDGAFPPVQVLDCRYVADAGAVSARQVGTCSKRVYTGLFGMQNITFVAQPTNVMRCAGLGCSETSSTSTFLGWGGPCAGAGTQLSCTVPLNQAKDVTAKFGLPPLVPVPS